ncbi:sensor histidine kinase [Streptomyces sp. VRA16 Mangrove soil]|uniref:sensor histidine kinase n=1 Tax=Streptomyces sp. VRA16 Mangrove soil TaxID=2817434 RepID=UPI001A9DFF96|nr:sensor histidine kinase [Streptomyces sp. VRA16 Mangrove soil]MBO1333071.1 sensor histidine kinase [Streptomyces sp. VRA16 Mangrove soil]
MSNASSSPDQPPRPPDEAPGRTGARRASAALRRGLGEAARWSAAAGSGLAAAAGDARTEPLFAHAPKRWMRVLPYVIALGFTATLIPVTTQVLSNDYGVGGGLAGAIGVAQAAPLLLAVSRPLAAWCIMIVADVLGTIPLFQGDAHHPSPWTPMVVVGYLALCIALALRESRRTLIGVWLVTVVASIGVGSFRDSTSQDTGVLLIVLSGGVLLLGALLRERGEAQRRLVEQETISEAERTRRTLLEERARIARELHDVVAHHMSVITVQADSAPYRLPDLPGEVREEFASIAAGARQSLTEMRRLLAVLRSEEAQGDLTPQPGLAQLQQLAEATRRGGVPTELSYPELALVRQLADVSPAVDLSAYRIVQEALANVVRHAPGARAQVSIGLEEDALLVIVVNGPAPGPLSPLESTGTGHGLVGMGERVRLVGGTLDVGPLPGGGFRVAARLPLTAPDSPTV